MFDDVVVVGLFRHCVLSLRWSTDHAVARPVATRQQVAHAEEGNIVFSDAFLRIALIGRSIALSLEAVAIHRPLWLPEAIGLSIMLDLSSLLLLAEVAEFLFFGGVDFHREFRLKRLFMLSLL